jgi:type IV pilus biogenesis protein CpaD/CtpE
MKNSLLILAGAAALSLASCSQEKTTEVTTVPADSMTTTTTTTTTGPMTDAQIEARAQRIADKMVADMKITDEATKTKIRTLCT